MLHAKLEAIQALRKNSEMFAGRRIYIYAYCCNSFCKRVQSTVPSEHKEMTYIRSDIENLKGCFMQPRLSDEVCWWWKKSRYLSRKIREELVTSQSPHSPQIEMLPMMGIFVSTTPLTTPRLTPFHTISYHHYVIVTHPHFASAASHQQLFRDLSLLSSPLHSSLYT